MTLSLGVAARGVTLVRGQSCSEIQHTIKYAQLFRSLHVFLSILTGLWNMFEYITSAIANIMVYLTRNRWIGTHLGGKQTEHNEVGTPMLFCPWTEPLSTLKPRYTAVFCVCSFFPGLSQDNCIIATRIILQMLTM